MNQWFTTHTLTLVLSIVYLASGEAAVTSYTNNLGNGSTVANDFDDYSSTASQMMEYGSGSFLVNNNRLEFSAANSFLGIKTLKTQVGINDDWAAQVDFHLKQIQNGQNGHYYDIGLVVALGPDFSSAFLNRIVFKAIQSSEGRIIKATFYSNNKEQKSVANSIALTNSTDGTLKFVFSSPLRSIACYFKRDTDSTFSYLCQFKLDNYYKDGLDYTAWSFASGSLLNISVFAGSEGVTTFPVISSGDMYLTNFSLSNQAISYCTLTTEMSEDLTNWSFVNTAIIPAINSKSFFRLKILSGTNSLYILPPP